MHFGGCEGGSKGVLGIDGVLEYWAIRPIVLRPIGEVCGSGEGFRGFCK